MDNLSREKKHQLIGELVSELVGLGRGVVVRRFAEDVRLTAAATDDLGAVEYFARGHDVFEAVLNLRELIRRQEGLNE